MELDAPSAYSFRERRSTEEDRLGQRSGVSPEDHTPVEPIALMVAAEAADHDDVRSWSCVLAMVVAFGGIAAEGRAVERSDVTTLLLTKRDVGAGYSLNRDFTQRSTLAERSEGMGATFRRDLAAKWVAGAQTGFIGTAAVSHQSIISTADVFQTSSVASIRKAWEARYLKLGSGARLEIPPGAPGTLGS